MNDIEFEKKDLWIKDLLGLPLYGSSLIFAFVVSEGNPLLSLFVILMGWYLYTWTYWKLYKHFVHNTDKKNHALLYVSAFLFQAIFIACFGYYAYA